MSILYLSTIVIAVAAGGIAPHPQSTPPDDGPQQRQERTQPRTEPNSAQRPDQWKEPQTGQERQDGQEKRATGRATDQNGQGAPQERTTGGRDGAAQNGRSDSGDRNNSDRNNSSRNDSGRSDMSDAMVTARVKAALLADREVGGLSIDVDTVQGVVHLRGEVDSQGEIDEARRLAEAVDGVRRVATDGLRIEGVRNSP